MKYFKGSIVRNGVCEENLSRYLSKVRQVFKEKSKD